MKHIFGNLFRHKGSVLLITLLLILQAVCDLSLPSYTSKIVDVGLQQYGIEDCVMQKMRRETGDALLMMMKSEEDRSLFAESYVLNEQEDIYELRDISKEERTELSKALELPEVMCYGSMHVTDMQQAGVTSADMMEKMAQISDAIITQMAVQFVSEEYTALGIDLNVMQRNYLLVTGAKMLLLSILMLIAAIGSGFLAARTAAKIGMELRSKVFSNVLGFSNTEMNHFSTASLITRSTNDIQQVQMVSVMLLRMVLYAPILGIGGVIKVVSTRTGMGWIIAVAVATISVLVISLMRVTMPKFEMMQKLVDRLNLVSREILTGLPVIRAFSREEFEEKRFDVANRNLMGTQLFTTRVMTLMMPLMMMIMNGVTVMIVWFGGKGIDMGNLQVGDMIAFITYTMQIIMSFLMLTFISVMLPRAGVAAERIDEVIQTVSSIHDAPQVRDDEQKEWNGTIAFEDVSFRYEGASEDALSHISFVAEPGKTTAIIGSTGCGKSTLVNLIPRFFDVTAGRITFDGIDIRELSQKKLRSMLGMVPQKGVLFSGDIASNLKFGGDEITDEQMKEAAEIAQAMEFIESIEMGFASEISQGGTNVSGGQKQRLSIARAIAKQPKVLIFDDSFSALDYKTDAALRAALAKKTKDATVIIVAQRINTILHADQILVLEDGVIVGKGTHEQLLNSCEAYQEIASSQLSEDELKGGVR